MREKLSILGLGVFVAWACGDDEPTRSAVVIGGPDASVDGSSDASTWDASLPPPWTPGPGPEPVCAAADPDCTCGWGVPEQLGVNHGYATRLRALAAGRTGQAIAFWGVEDEPNDSSPTVWVRELDPRTERWQESSEFAMQVSQIELDVDRAGANWVVFTGADSAGNFTTRWSRFDSDLSQWSPSEPMPFAGDLIAGAARGPALLEYPLFSFFDRATKTWSAPPADGPPEPDDAPYGQWMVVDDDRNLMAYWDEVTAIGGGIKPIPNYQGVRARYYDAARRTWRAIKALESTGQGARAIFDGAGRAHVITLGKHVHVYDPAADAWAAPVTLSGSQGVWALLRDQRGDIHAFTSDCADLDCRARVTRFDAASGAWQLAESRKLGPTDPRASVAGFVEGASGHALMLWFVPAGDGGSELSDLWAARFDPSGEWSAPELAASGVLRVDSNFLSLAIGSGGHAAVAWSVEYLAPIGETREGVDVTRFDPAAGQWTRVSVGTGNTPDDAQPAGIAIDAIGNTTLLFDEDRRTYTGPNVWDTETSLLAVRWACKSPGSGPEPRPDGGPPIDAGPPPVPGCLDFEADGSCGKCGYTQATPIAAIDFSAIGIGPSPAIGVGAGGHALAAWWEQTGIVARAFDPVLGNWSEPIKIKTYSEYVDVPLIEVVVDASGAASVIWKEPTGLVGAWSGAVPSGSPRVWAAPRPLTEPESVYDLHIFRSGARALFHWGNGSVDKALDADLATGTWGTTQEFSKSCYFTRPFIRPEATGFQMLWANPPPGNVCGVTGPPAPEELRSSRFASATGSWSAPVRLAHPLPGYNHYPAPAGSGNVLLPYASGSSEGFTVWATHYDAAAGRLGAITHMGADPSCSGMMQVLGDAAGNGFAVWANTSSASGCSGGSQRGVWASRFDGATKRWLPPSRIWSTGDWPIVADLRLIDAPGGMMALFTEKNALTSLTEEKLWGIRLDAATGTVSQPEVVAPAVAVDARTGFDAAGNVHVVYNHVVGGEKGTWTVHANRFDAVARKWAPAPVALGHARNWRGKNAVDFDVASDGSAAAVWGDERTIWATRWRCE